MTCDPAVWCVVAAGVVSNVVQHVVVPVVDSSLCNRLYEEIADKVKLDISDDMMCAGIEEGGRDACQVPSVSLTVHSGCALTRDDREDEPNLLCHILSLIYNLHPLWLTQPPVYHYICDH